MTEFNKAWNRMEPDAAAEPVIEHLLRGPGTLEDRLTALIHGKFSFSINGFKEPLLTKGAGS